MNERQLNRYAKMALEDQIPCLRILFCGLTVLVFCALVFGAPSELAILGYGVSVGLMCAFTQVNHVVAEHLEHCAVLFREVREYLSHLMDLCSESLANFLSVKPRQEISFFDRLSNLLGLVERPYPNAPLAFRS